MKKTRAFFAVLCGSFVFGQFAFAREADLSKFESPNLVCESRGALIAINTEDERVWQADPGETEGLELNLTEFRTARCPNCYSFKGTLEVFGAAMDVEGLTTGVPGSFTKATLSYTLSANGSRGQTMKFNCKTVQ